jgi:hypothetical protein
MFYNAETQNTFKIERDPSRKNTRSSCDSTEGYDGVPLEGDAIASYSAVDPLFEGEVGLMVRATRVSQLGLTLASTVL